MSTQPSGRARSARREPVGRSSAAVGAVLALLLVVGCSGAGEGGDAGPGRLEAPPGSLPTTTTIRTVQGKLPADRRGPLKRSVTATVDRWLDAAYVGGDYPRAGGFRKAFPGFSSGAKAEARRDLRLMTNVGIAQRVRKVVVRRRDVRLDVLATRGRASAVTAAVDLVFQTRGQVSRRDRVRGRLHLTWRNGGWQVFGYDMARGSSR
ncbi:hypothetical protein [Nocardioides sp. SYSU DS0663]|uniref:hypothetical protein n=1 Tax=Nocardioides sp. SYSU DS0663 TaxID=3416445 RepID=UPI003F4B04FA